MILDGYKLFWSGSNFLANFYNLDLYKMIWTWPKQIGPVQNFLLENGNQWKKLMGNTPILLFLCLVPKHYFSYFAKKINNRWGIELNLIIEFSFDSIFNFLMKRVWPRNRIKQLFGLSNQLLKRIMWFLTPFFLHCRWSL